MSVSNITKLLLAFKSGNRCAFPGCGQALAVDGNLSNAAIIGEVAHIAGKKPGAARYDESMTDEQRDHYDNLIYLCGNHHNQIDRQYLDYSTDDLHQIKTNHEQRVREAMSEAFPDVGFQELMEATNWIDAIDFEASDHDFSLIPPEDKIRKNKLGSGSRNIITMGLSVAQIVKKYIESSTQTDPDYPERLKTGFLSEYYRLKNEGHKGDELFNLMCSFAQRGLTRSVKQSAGIAVLVYLFETCEVFEK